MDADLSNARLLAIACRFVPYDQWFVTHLDSSWRIHQVKLWLLSKANSLHAPADPPRYRPVSPIVFANDSESALGLYDEDGDESVDAADEHDRLIQGQSARSRRSKELSHETSRTSFDRAAAAPDASTFDLVPNPKDENDAAARYMLVTFSTGQILEDDFTLSWYKLRPYELLELHRAGELVPLPRHELHSYVSPYLEVPVLALRVVWREGKEKNREGDGQTGSGSSGRTKRRSKLEWSQRWVIIHQGILRLCRDRSEINPTRQHSLSALCALRGAEHLSERVSHRNIDVPASKHVVCAKFRTSRRKVKSPPASPTDTPASSEWTLMEALDAKWGNSDGEEDDKAHDSERSSGRPGKSKEDSEWVVLDMIDDNAFSAILRILHRHHPPPMTSTFVDTPSSSAKESPLPPTAAIGTLPYPEWRLEITSKAQRAGMGEIGRAMEQYLWGESSAPLSSYRWPSSDDDSFDSDGEDSDGVSDVEWEGWARDLPRAQRRPSLSVTSVFATGRRGSVVDSTGAVTPAEDQMLLMERRWMEPSGVIYVPNASEEGAPSLTGNANEVVRHLNFPSANASSSSSGLSTPRPPIMRVTTTSTVSVGTVTPLREKKKDRVGRARSSTITTTSILRKPRENVKGKEREQTPASEKDDGKEKERRRLQKPKLNLSFSPPTPSSEFTGFAQPSWYMQPRPNPLRHSRSGSSLRHARSGSSLCTSAGNFGDEEQPRSPTDGAVGKEKEKRRRKLGALVRGASTTVRTETSGKKA